jgi:hypothetical protein
MVHKNKQIDYFHTSKQKSTWWQPQPRGAIFQVLATSTELAHKLEQKFSYWHFVILGVPTNIDTWCVICVAFNSALRQRHRSLFPYVQLGCVMCTDDVGLPQASNVGRIECVSLMVKSYLTDTQFEIVCYHDLCRGSSVFDFLLDSGESVRRVLP